MSVTSFSNLLGFALPTTGDLTGTWGDTVNTGITALVDSAVAGTATASVASGNWTLTSTQGATNEARAAILKPTGSPGVSRNIIAPSQSKAYIVINQSNAVVVVKGTATTGVSIVAGATALVAWDGSDFVDVTAIASGLRSATTTVNVSSSAAPTEGQVLTATAGTTATWQTPPTLTAANSLNSATTTVNVSSSAAPTTGQVLTATSGTAATWQPSTDLPLSGGVMTGDIAFNAGQTFAIAGSSSTLGAIITSAAEVTTVSATAATGIINYDVTTQSVLYYTTSASANWTVNVRASSGTPLNTALATGQSITLAFMVTQGATAFYNNAFTIDGVSVTPKWQGGTAPTAGNAAGIDVYTYTITKTASATYIILASLTQFK